MLHHTQCTSPTSRWGAPVHPHCCCGPCAPVPGPVVAPVRAACSLQQATQVASPPMGSSPALASIRAGTAVPPRHLHPPPLFPGTPVAIPQATTLPRLLHRLLACHRIEDRGGLFGRRMSGRGGGRRPACTAAPLSSLYARAALYTPRCACGT